MAAILHTLDQRRLIDTNGIADGAEIYFYTTDTLTPASVYTTAALDVEHTQPIVVAAGAAVPDIYLDSTVTYRRRIVYPDGTDDDTDPYDSGAARATDLASTDTGKGASMLNYEDGDTGQDFQERFALPTGVNTAAELEAFLTANEGRAILKPGTTYTVETLPLPTEDNLFIDGQGSTLTNVNATPIDENDIVNITFMPGTSHPIADGNLTFHSISAVDGELLTTDGTEFEVGDLVMVRGATSYTAGSNTIYRNVMRARVLATTSTTVTLDRAVPAEISDDTPAIANSNEGVSAGGNLTLFYLYAPRIQNLTLASAEGSPMQRGGCIDGIFRNITFVGRNSLVMNAMQDCLFDGVRFHTWRKMAELAQACRGTTVRNLRGSLSDGSTKNGGASDNDSFFIGIHENSVECTIEDIDISSGPNDPGTDVNAMQLGGGRRNVIRNGTARFPEHTGTGLSIQSGTSNAGNEDCGFENLTVYLPSAATLFRVSDGGSGVSRPYARNLTVFGTTSTGFAADLCGSDGVFENLWFEDGGCRLNTLGTLENCRITDCYFPDGFTNLTQELLATNDIRDNQSDASRRIMAAAKVAATQTTVSETAANTAFPAATMTIAAGDLAAGDAVHLRLAGTKGGTNNAHIRVTCQTDGSTPFELAHIQTTTNGDAWEIAGAIEVQSNTTVYWRGQQVTSAGATGLGVRNAGGNLTNNGLVVTVEIWTETSGNVLVQSYAIAGQKLGMRNVKVFP